VSVVFRGETRSTKAGQLGRWSIYLKPGGAGGPFQMTIQGTPLSSEPGSTPSPMQTITLDDVLVGDVWVASGQSNMEFEMRKAVTAELIVKRLSAESPQDDAETDGWQDSSPESAKDFSAVAWYFAREIEQREHVPVGVIDSTWGGTLAEAWTRLTALGEDAALAPLFVSRGKMIEHESDAQLEIKDQLRRKASLSRNSPGTLRWQWTVRACFITE
jgi:sialate O-acetylesterase